MEICQEQNEKNIGISTSKSHNGCVASNLLKKNKQFQLQKILKIFQTRVYPPFLKLEILRSLLLGSTNGNHLDPITFWRIWLVKWCQCLPTFINFHQELPQNMEAGLYIIPIYNTGERNDAKNCQSDLLDIRLLHK